MAVAVLWPCCDCAVTFGKGMADRGTDWWLPFEFFFFGRVLLLTLRLFVNPTTTPSAGRLRPAGSRPPLSTTRSRVARATRSRRRWSRPPARHSCTTTTSLNTTAFTDGSSPAPTSSSCRRARPPWSTAPSRCPSSEAGRHRVSWPAGPPPPITSRLSHSPNCNPM